MFWQIPPTFLRIPANSLGHPKKTGLQKYHSCLKIWPYYYFSSYLKDVSFFIHMIKNVLVWLGFSLMSSSLYGNKMNHCSGGVPPHFKCNKNKAGNPAVEETLWWILYCYKLKMGYIISPFNGYSGIQAHKGLLQQIFLSGNTNPGASCFTTPDEVFSLVTGSIRNWASRINIMQPIAVSFGSQLRLYQSTIWSGWWFGDRFPPKLDTKD